MIKITLTPAYPLQTPERWDERSKIIELENMKDIYVPHNDLALNINQKIKDSVNY